MAELKLPCGRIALIDDADLTLIAPYNWYAEAKKNRTVYVIGRLPKQRRGRIYLHKLIAGYPITDHRDGNGLNNHRANLRPCSPSENCCNVGKRSPTKPFKGVYFNRRKKRNKRWYVQVYKNYICYFGGFYDSPEQAALAYDALARQLHGEFARLNFSEQVAAEEPARC